MRLLTIIISIITVSYLALDFAAFNNSPSSNASNQAVLTPYKPETLIEELSRAEQDWQQKKNERVKQSETKTKTQSKIANKQQKLTIGEQKYVLYGIFNDTKKPFILLKGEDGKLFRLSKGDKLAEDATLVALQSNKISFDRNNQIIEFKLFERKK